MNEIVFAIGLTVLFSIFIAFVYSSKNRQFEFWPPPEKDTWQYHLLWWSIRLLVISIGWLIYKDNSTMNISNWLRFYIAMPLFILTFSLGTIAAFQLGWRNTHGEAKKFISSGFYKYSRNPQYVLYSISFLFLGLWVGSLKALILLVSLGIFYLAAPFPEERWLEKKYGKDYISYKQNVPRYFRWKNNA